MSWTVTPRCRVCVQTVNTVACLHAQASHGANAELRCQVDLLQQKLAQAERRARMAAATAAPPTPAVAAPDTLRHEAMQPVASGSATVMADLTAARRDLAAAHAEVQTLKQPLRSLHIKSSILQSLDV